MFFWATLYLVLIFDIEIWYIIYYLELPQRMRFQRRLSEMYTVFFPILIHGAWHIRLFFLRQKIYRLFKVFEVVIEVSSCVGNPVFKQNCFLLDPMLLFYYIICLSVYYILCLSVCPFIFNKRENGWPNQTQILCGTSYEVREGLYYRKKDKAQFKRCNRRWTQSALISYCYNYMYIFVNSLFLVISKPTQISRVHRWIDHIFLLKI